MNCKKLLIITLILGIALFTLSGCTVVLLALGANYLLGEPTEPTEPESTNPEPTNFRPAFKSRAYPYWS
jgi:flagellar basal body-associated protein FliL